MQLSLNLTISEKKNLIYKIIHNLTLNNNLKIYSSNDISFGEGYIQLKDNSFKVNYICFGYPNLNNEFDILSSDIYFLDIINSIFHEFKHFKQNILINNIKEISELNKNIIIFL